MVSGRRTILAPYYVARACEFAARIIEPAKGAAATADLAGKFAPACGEAG